MEDLTPIGIGIVTAVMIVAMANPLLLAPMFINATAGMSKAKQRSVSVMAVLVGGGILIGSLVLSLFGITTTALQVAGGLIFIQLGFGMLGGNSNRPSGNPEAEVGQADIEAKADEGPNPGVFPLGMPGIGGPGLIAISIGIAGSFEDTIDAVAMIVGVLVAVVFGAFLLAPKLAKVLGPSGIDIMTKIFGLIVLSLAVVMITPGVGVLWPGLLG